MTAAKAYIAKLIFTGEQWLQEHAAIVHDGIITAVLPVAELQARWASKVFIGEKTLPCYSEMRDITDLDWKKHLELHLPRDRMSIYVDQLSYMDSIADEIGVKPDLWKLWKSNWELARIVTFGPVVSAQYRLFGDGKWEGAAAAIEAACYNLEFGPIKKPENHDNL